MKIGAEEIEILRVIDTALRQKSVIATIDSIVKRVVEKLNRNSGALLAWEPVPLKTYSKLPEMIRSSWVFILRAQATTGAERHPNSHQRMMSYRDAGDLQIWSDDRWHSNFLVSDPDAPLEKRWVSIPINVWHQAVVPEKNWVVVSFHTVPAEELIEERPNPSDKKSTHQRRYLG